MTMNRILIPGLLAVTASTAAARTASLAEQPAVRHRYELRASRLELSPTFEASVAADFKHTLSGGLKLEYHITDALSIGALGFYGTSVNTGLLDQIVSSLPASMPPDKPDPSQAQALDHVNRIPIHGGVGITFTPWFGKMGLFGRAFLSYDVYITGGFGFAITENDYGDGDDETKCDSRCDDGDPSNDLMTDPRNDGPHNAGFNPGVQFGGGLHLFLSNFAALDLSLRNYMFTDNPSGFDNTFDKAVTKADQSFTTHLFVGVGISLYLPARPAISR